MSCKKSNETAESEKLMDKGYAAWHVKRNTVSPFLSSKMHSGALFVGPKLTCVKSSRTLLGNYNNLLNTTLEITKLHMAPNAYIS